MISYSASVPQSLLVYRVTGEMGSSLTKSNQKKVKSATLFKLLVHLVLSGIPTDVVSSNPARSGRGVQHYVIKFVS
jgi:hypothetical protein